MANVHGSIIDRAYKALDDAKAGRAGLTLETRLRAYVSDMAKAIAAARAEGVEREAIAARLQKRTRQLALPSEVHQEREATLAAARQAGREEGRRSLATMMQGILRAHAGHASEEVVQALIAFVDELLAAPAPKGPESGDHLPGETTLHMQGAYAHEPGDSADRIFDGGCLDVEAFHGPDDEQP